VLLSLRNEAPSKLNQANRDETEEIAMSNENKNLVRRWVEEIFNARNLDVPGSYLLV